MEENVTIKLVCKKEGSEVLTVSNLEWLFANFYPQGSPYKVISVERDLHKEKKEVALPFGLPLFFMSREGFKGFDDKNFKGDYKND